jgi:NAD(P)-dependent dehydrogenase (short-subunit alcohol dehydrogenase family)/quinol monooxygenase YgiN
MAEIEIVRIPVDPPNAPALEAVIRERRADYFAPPHCLALEVGRSEDEADVIAVVTWASKEAHAAARKGPGAAALFAAVGKLATGAPWLASLAARSTGAGRLAGQVILVTGGASGIGRAVVDRFVTEGARVGVVDRNAPGLALVREAHGDKVITIEADVATASGNRQAVERTVAAFGKLDCLVANAGMFDGFCEFATLDVEALDRAFDAIFNINVRGLLLGCRTALPHLAASRGSIVITLSNASLLPDGGGVMYVASKHAELGVMRQLAHELAPHVRVNAVAPGATKTPIGVPDIFGESLDQQAADVSAAIAKLVPLEIHSLPTDHTGAYVLLAARDESPAMTGTVISSDGGLGVRGLRRTRGGDHLMQTLGVRPA